MPYTEHISELYIEHYVNDPVSTAKSIRNRILYSLLVSQSLSLEEVLRQIAIIAEELGKPIDFNGALAKNGDAITGDELILRAIAAGLKDAKRLPAETCTLSATRKAPTFYYEDLEE